MTKSISTNNPNNPNNPNNLSKSIYISMNRETDKHILQEIDIIAVSNTNLKIDNLIDTNTDTNTDMDTKNITKQPSQLEMMEYLTAKIKQFKNVEIKTKEVVNKVGSLYSIKVRVDLSNISNGIFHSATLKTVSYNSRIINIKCVFVDNDNLIRDMKVNRDSLFQCFRDIIPDTITSITLEQFTDFSDTSHLAIVASTIRGTSLIFIYKRMMEFVNIINEKYGMLIITPTQTISTGIANQDLDAEEQILQSQLDNIRLLKQAQKSIASQEPIASQQPINVKIINVCNASSNASSNVSSNASSNASSNVSSNASSNASSVNSIPLINTFSFAYKVTQNLKKLN